MGADMLVQAVAYEAEGFTPDWEIGKVLIKNLFSTGKLQEDDMEFMLQELDEFRDCFNSNTREVTRLRIGPFYILVTGGLSWGDTPTDMFSTIGFLNDYAILEACGFYKTPDYKKIIDIVLDKAGPTVLPLLHDLDPDLDDIVKEKLKGE